MTDPNLPPDQPPQQPGGGWTPPPPPPPGGMPPPPPQPPGPPPGGMPPPPPPPPAGGYQQPYGQQPYGQPQYGQAPYQAYNPAGEVTGQADIGSAFNWTFKKFQEHLGPFLTLAGIIAAVQLVGGLLSNALINSADDGFRINPETGRLEDVGNFWGGIAGSLVVSVVIAILVWILRIGVLRAALRTTRGETPSVNDLTTGTNLGNYILTALAVGILTAIGLVLCILPGLLVAFFTLFAPTHALDKGAGVGDAIRWSFHAVKHNVVPVIVLVLITIVVGVITGFLGGVAGAIVAALLTLALEPLAALLNANLYRQMGAEPIAP